VARSVVLASAAGKTTTHVVGRRRSAEQALRKLVTTLLPGATIEKKKPGVWVAEKDGKTIRLRSPVNSREVRHGHEPQGTWTIDLGNFGVTPKGQDNFKVFFNPIRK
jgi:hypothetical protein